VSYVEESLRMCDRICEPSWAAISVGGVVAYAWVLVWVESRKAVGILRPSVSA